jgi:hypothetical protein
VLLRIIVRGQSLSKITEDNLLQFLKLKEPNDNKPEGNKIFAKLVDSNALSSIVDKLSGKETLTNFDKFANVPADNVFNGHKLLKTTTLKLSHPTKHEFDKDERFVDNEIYVSPVFLNTSSSIELSPSGNSIYISDVSPLNVPLKRVVNGHSR